MGNTVLRGHLPCLHHGPILLHFLFLPCFQPSSPPATCPSFSRFFLLSHSFPRAKRGGGLSFHFLLFLLLGLLEQYTTHPGCAVLMAPLQDHLSPSWTTFWRPVPVRRFHACFFQQFIFFSMASTPTSRPCSYAHSAPCSRLCGGGVAHDLLPHLLLSRRNAVFFHRERHGKPGSSLQFKSTPSNVQAQPKASRGR